MSTCGRVSIYRCISVHINILTDIHRHTRTYTDGTRARVCVCVAHAHRPVYTGKAQAYCQRGFSVQKRSRRQTTQPPKGKQPPMSEVGRQPARADTFLPEKGSTDSHPEAQGRKQLSWQGWAGLGWAGLGLLGVGAGSRKHPGAFIWTTSLLLRRGKAQELASPSRQQVRHIRKQWLLIDRTRLFCR